jgi:hypothetical protein
MPESIADRPGERDPWHGWRRETCAAAISAVGDVRWARPSTFRSAAEGTEDAAEASVPYFVSVAGGGDPMNEAVRLAVCLGWRMAELYDSKELPGPPENNEPEPLPEHLPGLGEMTDHEKALALVAHMGADLASLTAVLGVKEMPGPEEVLNALMVPRHSRDEVQRAVLDLYLKVRDLLAGSNVPAAVAFGLGRMLADTALLPTKGDSKTLAERFNEYRLQNAFGWLDDLDTRLPPHSAAAVGQTLRTWEQWVGALPRTPEGGIESCRVDKALIRALDEQGKVWRRLLTGEQRAEQLLGRRAYIEAASGLLAAAWHIGLRYLWKWSWLIVLVGGATGAAAWAAVTYAPAGTSRVAAVVVSAAGFLGISWLSVRATLGRALRQAENALWEAEVAIAIAKAATILPEAGKSRRTLFRKRADR